ALACEQFMTVLAPGADAFHFDHIHMDLMRRANGRRICQPAAVDGETVAARALGRTPNYPAYPPNYSNPPPVNRIAPPQSAPNGAPVSQQNDPYAWRGAGMRRSNNDDRMTTGSVGSNRRTPDDDDWIEDESPRPAVR